MITFVMSDDHHYTITTVLETRGHPRHGGIIMLSYREFLLKTRLPVADYVFVDLERQTVAVLRAVHPAIKVLNPPSPRLGRLEVMQQLHRPGMNRFRVMAATDIAPDLSFPVFLRRLDDHEGPTTGLRPDAQALQSALDALIAKGIPRDVIAVTEYVNARNADGWHEKRSYFCIGGMVFPAALDASRNWICKGVVGDTDTVDVTERERAFLSGQSDDALMRPAFEAAGITYGRADYAVVDGHPQVFEINTNPMIERPEVMPDAFRDYSETVLARWMQALEDFSAPHPGEVPHWVDVGGAVNVPSGANGHRVRRAIRRVLSATGRLHRETSVMRKLRAVGIMR